MTIAIATNTPQTEKPTLLIQNIFLDGSVSVSSAAADGAGANAITDNTFDYWTATAATANIVYNEPAASGGTTSVINDGGTYYRVHTFTGNGTLTVNRAIPSVEYLVVAGGGGGGRGRGGGGGSGGMLTGTYTSAVSGSVPVVVGSGGAGAQTGVDERGQNGVNSTIAAWSLTAVGGGGGGSNAAGVQSGANGGSGGGGAGASTSFAGGTGTVGQGNDGGTGFGSATTGDRGAGGGGGAGVVGANGTLATGGNGGNGLQSGITGALTYYAGGGGGGGTTGGNGGLGGGGAGGGTPVNATANTGGGGGGANGAPGGNGGSGVVIVRYEITESEFIGASVECDAVGIAAHTLGTVGATVQVQSSTNATTWTTRLTVTPTDDSTIFGVFPAVSAPYWRVRITNGPASIGVLKLGKRVVVPTGVLLGHVSVDHAARIELLSNDSLDGQFLGTRVIRRSGEIDVDFGLVERDFVEGDFREFETKYNEGRAFFYAGSPLNLPLDVGYCKRPANGREIRPTFDGGELMQLDFEAQVYVG